MTTSINSATTLTTIQTATTTAMNNTIVAFEKQLEKLHTGRASPALLESLQISQPHGGYTLLSHVARISVLDAQTLMVAPWDKSLLPVIQKAISQSTLGLNPASQGEALRVPLPPLSDKRRQDIVRMVSKMAENMYEELRNHRRSSNTHLKIIVKENSISEDENHRAQTKIQKLTDEHVKKIRKIAEDKEKQVLQNYVNLINAK